MTVRTGVSSGEEKPGMTGSSLLPIILPIVAIVALAAWLGMVFWADAHPGRKAPGADALGADVRPATAGSGAAPGGELPPPSREVKAA
jgi:hypothetical protein